MARAKLRCIVGCPGLKNSYRGKVFFVLEDPSFTNKDSTVDKEVN